jgi:uncharacterized surface protein with fasciclin (FAS1) repeats
MKKTVYIISFFLALIIISCQPEPLAPNFEDVEDRTAYDYMMENEEEFSSFIAILEKGGIAKTMSAYNPDGIGYTLFLPDNNAVNHFIDNNPAYSSLNDILNDQEFVDAFSRYHVVNMEINSNEFPFGAFSEPTLSGDFLTVSFVIETDTSYYKINNSAAVTKSNIEVSNGYIHLIESALTPITFTSYEWLGSHPEYSIFKEAVDRTGLQEIIDINLKEFENQQPVTILAEPDSIFNKDGIYSVDDLIAEISPDNDDYTNESNPLYNFVSYHFLNGRFFIDDFVDVSTNYTTYSDIPLNINGNGLDIAINKGKQVFDTIVVQSDTTFIDFIKFKYDASNVLTQTGAIHFIDRVMRQQTPSRAIRTFEFYEEPLFDEYRQEGGTFIIEGEEALQTIQWTGADLFFVDLGEEESSAWGADYLEIDGDFTISYTIPKIIQGRYTVLIGAEAFNAENALIEVFIDNKKVGSLVDLSTGGTSDNPFQQIELGTIDFTRYSEHVVEIRPLIPGRFLWDYIRFEPF